MPRFTVTWTTKTQIAPTVYEIVLQTLDPLINYIPGQYINLDFGNNQYRSYSVAGLEIKNGKILIILIVDILANGLASGYFSTNHPPLVLLCIGPIGRFNLSPSPRKKVFIATNTGIAPIIAMISQMSDDEKNSVEIIFGVKSQEYDYLSRYINTTKIKSVVCISQVSDNNGTLFAGRVTDYYKLHSAEYIDCDFYLCGNPNMVSDMKILLEENGVGNDRVFTEKFLMAKK
jgi:all-trans-retinol 13,14-reductase